MEFDWRVCMPIRLTLLLPAASGATRNVSLPITLLYARSLCSNHAEHPDGVLEVELGIMKMFGGFSSSFFNEYHSKYATYAPAISEDQRSRFAAQNRAGFGV